MKKEKIKYILFDIGGVMVNHIAALRKIANQININEEKTISLFKKHANDIDRGILSWLTFEQIFYANLKPISHLEDKLIKSFVNNFEIIQQTHDFIYELKEYMNIGILSNISVDVFDLVKEKSLIPKIDYSIEIVSGKIGWIKPQKEIFDFAISKIKALPKEVLFVDDNEVYTKAADSYGWKSVLFDTKNPNKSIEKIKIKLNNPI